MNLRGIVAVSGRPGLFKLIGQNKVGYILESLDAQKLKIVANMTQTKLASLEDITVYGEQEEIRLHDVFANITKSNGSIPDAKADGTALRNFFREVAPSHDEEKVYASDMKKIISWYLILKELPLFTEDAPSEVEESSKTEEKVAEKKVKATAKPVKAKATAKTSAPAKKATMPSKRGA